MYIDTVIVHQVIFISLNGNNMFTLRCRTAGSSNAVVGFTM